MDLPALPLQLLLSKHPGWRDAPIVVVQDERPLAKILWLNREARRAGICRGMSFSQAQTLSARLRAGVVQPEELEKAVRELFQLLLLHSPSVQVDSACTGLFWLDPNGLEHLYGGYQQWACQVHRALTGRGYVAKVVVGFSRYLVFAITRAIQGTLVLCDSRLEQRMAYPVRLDRLDLPPAFCAELACLGIDTLGRFLELKSSQIRVRYGAQAARLHELASGKVWTPLLPYSERAPIKLEREVDPPAGDQSRILFTIKSMLQQLSGLLLERCEAIAGLIILFELDHAPPHREEIETAAPTLDLLLIVDLIRLRLSAAAWAAPVEGVEIELKSVRVEARQLSLLKGKKQRDLDAANRALARVKAAFGADSVTRARLRKAYLPEASFAWEPLGRVHAPKPPPGSLDMPLVRRFCAEREPLSAGPAVALGPLGKMVRRFGPFRVAGGWWRRRVERDYYFVETEQGRIFWLYYDRPRRCWVVHGTVE
ncbi:MAG: DNA polymerase Y family protein [Deltaproteobacteria bacterium]|nr:DNA polymerase Y family protein [Deltaproteobacteria bacterium]